MMNLPAVVLLLVLGGAAAAAGGPATQRPAQEPPVPREQRPLFRVGVDILSIDATVVDRDGRQITDLEPTDFVVEVDGDARPVVTAEYIKLVDDTPVPIGAPKPAPAKPSPDEAFFSTNARALNPGRHIVLLVDQGNIRVGQGRLVMRSAAKFIDALAPVDRVAMVAIPQGQLVDFTSDHEKIREALLATVGQATPFQGRFHISLSEAIATVEHSDATLRQQLMLRECGGVLTSPVDVARCEIEVEQEAGEVVSHQRQQTQNSLRGMREVLRSLGALEGPKSVILISEGLVLEGLSSDVDEIAAIAADVRASLDVMLLDVPPVDVSESQRPTTPREDRDRQTEGLESLAGLSRGALHRVITTGDNAFRRILQSLAGHYLLGVESRPRDRDGRRHRIQVKSTRRGVTVHSRRGFLAPPAPSATSAADAVGRALKAPLTRADLPVRIATWTYKEPGGGRVRVIFSTEVERAIEQSLDYTAGLALIDRNNRLVATNVERKTLSPSDTDPGLAVYTGSILLDPGTYLMRLAVADSEGRVGSVERKVDAWQLNATGLTIGDLMIAQAPPRAGTAAIEPRVSNGRLAAMMEIYAPSIQTMDRLQATVEVVASEASRPLTSAVMEGGIGSSPEVGVLQATLNTTALPPGRYLARAVIVQGGKPQGHLVRPFRVIAPSSSSAEAATAGGSVASSLPADLLGAMFANLPLVDRSDLLKPDVLTAVLAAAERARPTAMAALTTARAGKLGPAALEALGSGDQPLAAFLRGVDLFSQGQNDRALQQFQVAMQQAPTFAPTRLYLGAALAAANRHREAASLLQSVTPDVAGTAPVARMAGLSWLRAGDVSMAIVALEKAGPASDAATERTLALAYVAANRPDDALPLLTNYLLTNPRDQEALLAGVYAIYASHAPSPRAATLAADQARAQTWAKSYAAQKGTHQALVDAWMGHLKQAH